MWSTLIFFSFVKKRETRGKEKKEKKEKGKKRKKKFIGRTKKELMVPEQLLLLKNIFRLR